MILSKNQLRLRIKYAKNSLNFQNHVASKTKKNGDWVFLSIITIPIRANEGLTRTSDYLNWPR